MEETELFPDSFYSSRQYDDTFNIFEGVFRNYLFLTVSALMIALQILIMFVGGQAFSIVRLTGPQWAISLVLGLLTLAIGALTRCIPNSPLESMVAAFKWRPKTESNPSIVTKG